MFKKVFWFIFVVVFIIVTIFVVKFIYNIFIPSSHSPNIEITDNVFECENDNSILSRAYIILLGFGDHNLNQYLDKEEVILQNSKTKGVLVYDYNENLSLEEISNDFIQETNSFIQPLNAEELILIGISAGGTVASYSLNKLDFEGIVKLHTIASPLRGCDNGGFRKKFVEGEGFWREIGIGLDQFITPSLNYMAYHHKTVQDEYLEQCYSAVEMQNNNLENSKEFYYPEENHGSIVNLIFDKILSCYQ